MNEIKDIRTLQEELRKEQEELVDKIVNLKNFLNKEDIVLYIGERQYELLKRQLRYMLEYDNVLNLRIKDLFTNNI